MADTEVKELVINTLTHKQFKAAQEAGTLSPYELYGTPDTSVRLPVLTPMWFDHITNDVSWLRADTFSWQSGDVYKAAYEHLTEDIDGAIIETETIADITITFYRAEDGHKICLPGQESNISALYEATGVAWYYILDTTNKQFKLPRTKFGFTGVRTGVGDYVEPELPNIRANAAFSYGTLWPTTMTGGFKSSGNAGTRAQGENGTSPTNLELDASASNPIYKDGATVQPPATQMYLYFYVGNFEQDSVEQTAGINAELFNGKLDIELSNANDTTKSTVVGWVIPDYSAGISLSGWQATNTNFTVPCAGYIQVVMATVGTALESFYIDDIPCCAIINSFTSYVGNSVGGRFIEGGVHTFRSSVPSRTQSVIFYPCKGVN